MAKLKAPLMSLGASGALGKALVFFGWKGLNVVREYVIPSNPKTTAQRTQRANLTDAVAAIHAAQARAVEPLKQIDQMAYALWGSIFATPRTWFNQAVKNWLDQRRAAKLPIIWRSATLTPAATQITLEIDETPASSALTDAEVYWGTSKTALINKQVVTKAELNAGIAITDMVTKTKYYLQVRPTLPDAFIGAYSGIYYAVTT